MGFFDFFQKKDNTKKEVSVEQKEKQLTKDTGDIPKKTLKDVCEDLQMKYRNWMSHVELYQEISAMGDVEIYCEEYDCPTSESMLRISVFEKEGNRGIQFMGCYQIRNKEELYAVFGNADWAMKAAGLNGLFVEKIEIGDALISKGKNSVRISIDEVKDKIMMRRITYI